MNNSFSRFVETYYDDIVAFFRSLIDFFKAVIGKVNGGAEDEEAGE